MTTVADLPARLDGRWARTVRTRGAIIDAWLDLISDGDAIPTARGVADRAGIGLRTVFQHFSDMNTLHAAAANEFMVRIDPCAAHISVDLALADRLQQVCHHRSSLYEQHTLVRRAIERFEPHCPEIREGIHQWERLGSIDAVRVFAPELDSMEYDVCCVRGVAVAAVLSWATWNQLRERRQLSAAQARMVIIDGVSALVS